MPQDNAADAGVTSEPVAAPAVETASTATTPETDTQTDSTARTSSLMDKLGLPQEVQQEYNESHQPEPEPEAAQAEAVAEPEAPEAEAEQPEAESHQDDAEELPKPNKDWPPEVQAEFTKRVGKEARKRRKEREAREKAEELADQLREQLESVQPVTVAPSPSDFLADVQNEQQLQARVDEARLVRDWCRQHKDGFTENEGKENEQFIPPEVIADRLSRAEDVIMFDAPRKQAELVQRRQYDGLARTHYETIFDRSSEDYQVANALLAQLPGLVNHPARNLILGDYISGVKARLAKAKPNGKNGVHKDIPPELTRPQPPIAPHVPAASSRSSAPSSRSKIEKAMNQVAQSDGSVEAITVGVRALREARAAKGNARSPVLV